MLQEAALWPAPALAEEVLPRHPCYLLGWGILLPRLGPASSLYMVFGMAASHRSH